jgi:5-methylcytosine-specific restriction protein A
MVFDPKVNRGEILNNERLRSIFKCGIRSGMRKSNTTNTMVLVSDHTRGVYTDIWKGDVLHYTGMGYSGDQTLTRENKILAESQNTDIDLHLFEVFKAGEYIYEGRVELTGKPYKSKQKGLDGRSRFVWIFPLRLRGDVATVILPEDIARKKEQDERKRASKLSDDELRKRNKKPPKPQESRYILSRYYDRDADVAEYVKRIANGVCQLCLNQAPFKNNNGEPFLEIHHIKWLSRGGQDNIYNAVALCPNCHRKLHILNPKRDNDYLLNKASKRS